MSPRTAAPPEQPSLFDPEPPPPPPAKPKPRSNRRHTLDLPRPWPKQHYCDPKCLHCGHDETDGTCPDGCLTICSRPPHRHTPDGKRIPTPVEICLITNIVHARIAQGASAYDQPGRRLAVATCPRCGRTNWHQPTPGRTYRTGQCGHSYIVTTEPTS